MEQCAQVSSFIAAYAIFGSGVLWLMDESTNVVSEKGFFSRFRTGEISASLFSQIKMVSIADADLRECGKERGRV